MKRLCDVTHVISCNVSDLLFWRRNWSIIIYMLQYPCLIVVSVVVPLPQS